MWLGAAADRSRVGAAATRTMPRSGGGWPAGGSCLGCCFVVARSGRRLGCFPTLRPDAFVRSKDFDRVEMPPRRSKGSIRTSRPGDQSTQGAARAAESSKASHPNELVASAGGFVDLIDDDARARINGRPMHGCQNPKCVNCVHAPREATNENRIPPFPLSQT